MIFKERLEMALNITTDQGNYPVLGGQIVDVDLVMNNYGFDCKVSFWVTREETEDALFAFFSKKDLMEVNFAVKGYLNIPDPPPEPMYVKGIVYNKKLYEKEISLDGSPVLYRLYTIQFADPAAVLWKQHFPCSLYVDKKMQDVFNEHKGAKILLEYDWAGVIDTQHPVICLGLGAEKNQASFYDFAHWFVARHHGVWNYDHATNKYKFSKEKNTQGTALFLERGDVEKLEVFFPETIRHAVKILNASTEDSQTVDVTQDQKVEGVRHDYLMRTDISGDVTKRKTLETSRLKPREAEIHVDFKQFPNTTFLPGSFIRFEKGLWSTFLYPKGKEYRVVDISLSAHAENRDPMADRGVLHKGYEVKCKGRLELKTDTNINRPSFTDPYWPIYVEGRVLSEAGAEAEKTYQIYQNSTTSQDVYKIKIPLFQDITVIALYNPNLLPGHFYFPTDKNARVLVGLAFQDAWIARFLEWRDKAQLPETGQGNHLLMGKKTLKADDLSQTSLRHYYEDNKPILNLKRTEKKDTEMIELKEGILIIQTKEEE